jgi:hypothetical protein
MAASEQRGSRSSRWPPRSSAWVRSSTLPQGLRELRPDAHSELHQRMGPQQGACSRAISIVAAWPKIGKSLFKKGHGQKGRWYFRHLELGPFFTKCGTQIPFSFNRGCQYKNVYMELQYKKCLQLVGRGGGGAPLICEYRTPFQQCPISKASTKCMEL